MNTLGFSKLAYFFKTNVMWVLAETIVYVFLTQDIFLLLTSKQERKITIKTQKNPSIQTSGGTSSTKPPLGGGGPP